MYSQARLDALRADNARAIRERGPRKVAGGDLQLRVAMHVPQEAVHNARMSGEDVTHPDFWKDMQRLYPDQVPATERKIRVGSLPEGVVFRARNRFGKVKARFTAEGGWVRFDGVAQKGGMDAAPTTGAR